ncbi:LOW QUALITY PROTEIN: integrin alpha-V-like [Bufo bufo]|uniref:LOW QUALITY PROTEIN: integrin alpha-V-like n=1 Tax=Bufo bufo TaxID=8384 RepID=UPI001ABDB07E|nr:LOW QUALITY PROTEIN: integrin alpha-V-like [Bufo bufo]
MGRAYPPARAMAAACLLLLWLLLPPSSCFNLDSEQPLVHSGPEGSYFGFAVDFFLPDPSSSFLLIGAPKANTSQPDISQGGDVQKCDWRNAKCQSIVFDSTGNRLYSADDPIEFKSNQWFGASLRAKDDKILACAPLYHWRTQQRKQEREPVGTCYLKSGEKIVEYAPCRSNARHDAQEQGFCQGGFSVDFTNANRVLLGGPGSFYWQGQIISDTVDDIVSSYNPNSYSITYTKQLATRAASPQYDDSYLGYSVAVGDFNGDAIEDFVSGVPRAAQTLGMVSIYDGQNMASLHNFTGEQMAAYFGYCVAATDVNGDGLMDLFVGAPLFMDRGSDGKLQEVGQVTVFAQQSKPGLQVLTKLNGFDLFSRFGSSIAPLGDLDQDGFNDIAIGAPYAGENKRGLVYIYNGRSSGIGTTPSQVLEGQWASKTMPASFGYSLKGATDVDENGYPDLVVGAFGADKAILYRSRPVITVSAVLEVNPSLLNPDNKTCNLTDTVKVSCFDVKFCLKASSKGKVPPNLSFKVELVLDKLKQKGAVRRALFLHNKQPTYSKDMTVRNGGTLRCEELQAYLRDESEFRDKLTPITVFMDYQMDYKAATDSSGLMPILNQFTPANLTKQAHILLDCGEDNICKPNLILSVESEPKQLYIGDDSPLTLLVDAQNQGEGAYEAELIVNIPPQADFIGVVRKNETLSRLSCAFKTENQTRLVVCDLGNPMKARTRLLAALLFSVHQLNEMDDTVNFDMQIQSSNQYDNTSPKRSLQIALAVMAAVEIRGVSTPTEVFLPIANWEPKEHPTTEDEVGPLIQHIFELRNNGPSTFSKAILNVQWPYRYQSKTLLYIMQYEIDGPMNCTSDVVINNLNLAPSSSQGDDIKNVTRNERNRRDLLEVEGDLQTLRCGTAQCLKIECHVERVEKGKSAILYIRSRLWTPTFMNSENQNHSYSLKSSATFHVLEFPYKTMKLPDINNSTEVTTNILWVNQSSGAPVPLWVIVLAVLSGLLLLALMVFIMYKLGFFKRVRPPQEEAEREQLQPQENGEVATDA